MNIPKSMDVPPNMALALSEYKIHEIGHDVLISDQEIDLSDTDALEQALVTGKFKRITNRKPIKPEVKYIATASLPAATANIDLANVTTPNWKTWLEPPTDQFYKAILNFESSHYTEWQMELFTAQQGYIKSRVDSDTKFTTDDYPSIVTINDNGNSVHPKFKMYNYSRYTLIFAQATIKYGHKYKYVDLKPDRKLKIGESKVPNIFDTIILGDVKAI